MNAIAITDSEARAEVKLEWSAVAKLAAHRARQYQAGGVFINESGPPDGYYNLPFFLAYAVLDKVLGELVAQGTLVCTAKRPTLDAKMKASRDVLRWQNYDRVDAGRSARNKLAHKAELGTKEDCLGYVSAIEGELSAWGVIGV